MESKIYARALDSIRLPVEHFLATGFYDEASLPGSNWDADVSLQQVSRIVRKVAQELKRPFIECSARLVSYQYVDDTSKPPRSYGGYHQKRIDLPEPVWSYGTITMPKRKYLMPMLTPLLLAAKEDRTAPVWDRTSPTLWHFIVNSKEFWDEYYPFILNDTDCRKARKLTS